MKMMTKLELEDKNLLTATAYEWVKVPNPPATRREKEKRIEQFQRFIPKIKILLTQFKESFSLTPSGLSLNLNFLLVDYTIKIQDFLSLENKDSKVKNNFDLFALQTLLDQISSIEEIKQEYIDQFVSKALDLFMVLLKDADLEAVTKTYTLNINFLNTLKEILNIFKTVWSFPRQQMQINYGLIQLAIRAKKTQDEKLIPIIEETLKIDLENIFFIDREVRIALNLITFHIENFDPKSKTAIVFTNYIYQFAEKCVNLFKKLIPEFLPHNECYSQWLIQILQTINFFINGLYLLHAENLVKLARPIIDDAKKLPMHKQYTDEILKKISETEALLSVRKPYIGEKPKIVDFFKKLKKDWTPVPIKVKDSSPQTSAIPPTITQISKNFKKNQKKKQKARQAQADAMLLPPESTADQSKVLKRKLKKAKKSLEKSSSRTSGLQSVLTISRDEFKKSQTQLESTEKKHVQVQQELAETQLTVSYQQQKLKSETAEIQELLATKKELSKRLRFLYSHTHSQEDKIQKLTTEKTKLIVEKSQQQKQLEKSSRKIQKLSKENTELNAELIDELEEVDVRTYQTIEQGLEIERLSLATDQLVEEKTKESEALRAQLAGQILQTTGLIQDLHAVSGLNNQLHSTLQETTLDLRASHKAAESYQAEISRLSQNSQRFGYAGPTASSMQSTTLCKPSNPPNPTV